MLAVKMENVSVTLLVRLLGRMTKQKVRSIFPEDYLPSVPLSVDMFSEELQFSADAGKLVWIVVIR